jgi:hypothetical protein
LGLGCGAINSNQQALLQQNIQDPTNVINIIHQNPQEKCFTVVLARHLPMKFGPLPLKPYRGDLAARVWSRGTWQLPSLMEDIDRFWTAKFGGTLQVWHHLRVL